MAFSTILVPIDYSEPSDAALRLGGQIARAFNGRVLVVYLLPLEVFTMAEVPLTTIVYDAPRIEAETDRLRRHAREVLDELKGEPPAFEVEAAWGSPWQDIVALAAERHVDLIVMGTHGRRGVKHVLLGSVAEKVVRFAPCPVLTTHAGAATGDVQPQRPAALANLGRHVGDVGGLMHPRPVTVDVGAMLEEARVLMVHARARHLPVVENGKLVGILSDRDLPVHAGQFMHTRVRAAMTPDPVTINADVSPAVAARIMVDRHVRALPVVDGEKILGIVSTTDILEDYVRAARG